MIENPILTAIVMVAIIIFLIIACAFVYLTTPGKFRFFDLPSVYCHRGYYNDENPENSIGAFKRCAEYNLAAELDVRTTADGEIVVFHDMKADRMCGVDKRIAEMTLEEIRGLRLNGTDWGIPLFTEVMEVLEELPIYCEIKTDSTAVDGEFLEKVYQLMKSYKGDIVAVSFNPYVLGWFKDNHPEIIRGQLSAGKGHLGKLSKTNEFLLSNLLTNAVAKPDFIAYRFDDKSFGFSLCRHYGTRLCGYTVRSMEDVETAAYNGYSSFVGENFDMTEV